MASIEYLEWIMGRPDQATYDLGSSDLRRFDPSPGQVVPDVLADLPDPDDDVTLRSQVAEIYGVDEDATLVAAGATHANFLTHVATLLAGNERGRALVERPGYEPLWRTPETLGAEIDRFDRPAEEDYRLSPDRVAEAIEPETGLVVISNRHNPSGRLADRETLREVAEVVADAGAVLLVDEVYAPYTADTADVPFGGPTAAGLPNTVVAGSLTKFHGLGGLRIGWLVGDPDVLDPAWSAMGHVPVRAAPSVALARRALANNEALARTARERIRGNHALLAEFVDRRTDLSGPVFDGSTFAFLAHDSADGNRVVEAAEDRDLLVVPGRFFDDPERFRVSLGLDPAEMETALDVLGETLDAC